MSGTEVLVVLAAVAGIIWVNWYFFLAGRRGAASIAAAEEKEGRAHGR